MRAASLCPRVGLLQLLQPGGPPQLYSPVGSTMLQVSSARVPEALEGLLERPAWGHQELGLRLRCSCCCQSLSTGPESSARVLQEELRGEPVLKNPRKLWAGSPAALLGSVVPG